MSKKVDLSLSLIVGLRNNVVYTKAFYNSVRSLYKSLEIVFVSYGSTDETHEWLEELSDDFVRYYVSNDSKTLSDTYNKGVLLATGNLVCYMHNDMILGEGFVEELTSAWRSSSVCFYTVVEPPVFATDEHNWKLIQDFGDSIDSFRKSPFSEFVKRRLEKDVSSYKTDDPFFFLCVERTQLLEIGGLDPIFDPMFCEDSDLLLRFKLMNMEMIQVPKAIAYHFVSKTSRFSEEFLERTKKIEENSVHNFYRKWGFGPSATVCKRYDIGVIVKNAGKAEMITIEPYVTKVYVDADRSDYIQQEQSNTRFDLANRICNLSAKTTHDVLLILDAKKMTKIDKSNMRQLSKLIEENYFSEKSFLKRLFFNKNDFKVGGIHFIIKNSIMSSELEIVKKRIVI